MLNTHPKHSGLVVRPGNRGSHTARSGQEPHTPGGTKVSGVSFWTLAECVYSFTALAVVDDRHHRASISVTIQQ